MTHKLTPEFAAAYAEATEGVDMDAFARKIMSAAPEPPAMAEIERAWHKARDAWLKQSRHGTQASADKAAIDVLASALAQPRDTVGE